MKNRAGPRRDETESLGTSAYIFNESDTREKETDVLFGSVLLLAAVVILRCTVLFLCGRISPRGEGMSRVLNGIIRDLGTALGLSWDMYNSTYLIVPLCS